GRVGNRRKHYWLTAPHGTHPGNKIEISTLIGFVSRPSGSTAPRPDRCRRQNPGAPVPAGGYHAQMDLPSARVRVAQPLRFVLSMRNRGGDVTVPVDGVSTVGHVVESLGVPRTEIGGLVVDGRPGSFDDRMGAGETVDVEPVQRPQRVRPRF